VVAAKVEQEGKEQAARGAPQRYLATFELSPDGGAAGANLGGHGFRVL
jgi:hypothetical protein